MRYVIIIASFCLTFACQTTTNKVNNSGNIAIERLSQAMLLLQEAYPYANTDHLIFLTDNVTKLPKNRLEYVTSFFRYDPNFLLSRGSNNADVGSPSHLWVTYWNSIAHANYFLNIHNDVEQDLAYKASLAAEAYLIRAYSHFMLVNIFAKQYRLTSLQEPGIPYVTSIERRLTQEYERLTVAEVYKNIEEDLLQGLKDISYDAYSPAKQPFHFTPISANAFAVRYYLYVGAYDQVIEYADECFNQHRKRTGIKPDKAVRANVKDYYRTSIQQNLLFSSTLSSQDNVNTQTTQALKDSLFNIFKGNTNRLSVIPKDDARAEVTLNSTGTKPIFTIEEVFLSKTEALTHLNKIEDALKQLNLFIRKRYPDFAEGVAVEDIVNFYNQNYVFYSSEERIRKGFFSYPYTAQFPFSKQDALLMAIWDQRRREFLAQRGDRWFEIKRNNLEVIHTEEDPSTLKKISYHIRGDDAKTAIQIPRFAVDNKGGAPNAY